MLRQLAFLAVLGLLIVASLRTEPLTVSEAQIVPTGTATSTATATSSPTQTSTPRQTSTTTLTPSSTSTASATPTATPRPEAQTALTATATSSVTPTSTPTSTGGPTRTSLPTSSTTPTRTATVTTTPSVSTTPTTTRVPSVTSTLSPTVTTTPTITPTAVPPLIQAMSASGITRSGATINWTTNIPATSQVEFGTAAGAMSRSTVDASLITGHRQVLTGLTAGTVYRYQVRSVSAGGALSTSGEGSFVTAPEGTGPDIANVTVRRLTATTAIIGWSTDTGSVAQIEYGATSNYGAFTLLKLFGTIPSQEMLLTGLRPDTDYHFRINAWDGLGYLAASSDFAFRTAVSGPATLLGDQTIQTERVTLAAGQAASYQYSAAQSGQVSLVRVYLDAGSSATVVRVAVYSDQAGTPGTILSQGSAPGLTTGWVTVNMPPISLVQGTRYWIAVMAPIGSGSLIVRDAGHGGSSLLSRQDTLAAFPLAWTSGAPTARSPMSVQVQQVPPAVTLTGPADGAIVTGNVTLSAVVDDDTPLARVQFFVDGLPVGPPLVAAPYTVTWDGSTADARLPHTIVARASDMLGRSGTSGMVGVQVDNGPVISAVGVSLGLTASSARVTWATDVISDAQVEFGPTFAYGASTPVDPRIGWTHEAQLTGLAPGTTYHYRVRSRDANGALAVSQDATFATPEP